MTDPRTLREKAVEAMLWHTSKLVERMRFDYGSGASAGFTTAIYRDGRTETQCPWCHSKKLEYGHNDCCVTDIVELTDTLEAVLALLSAEPDGVTAQFQRWLEYAEEAEKKALAAAGLMRELSAQLAQPIGTPQPSTTAPDAPRTSHDRDPRG